MKDIVFYFQNFPNINSSFQMYVYFVEAFHNDHICYYYSVFNIDGINSDSKSSYLHDTIFSSEKDFSDFNMYSLEELIHEFVYTIDCLTTYICEKC